MDVSWSLAPNVLETESAFLMEGANVKVGLEEQTARLVVPLSNCRGEYQYPRGLYRLRIRLDFDRFMDFTPDLDSNNCMIDSCNHRFSLPALQEAPTKNRRACLPISGGGSFAAVPASAVERGAARAAVQQREILL